MGTNRLLLLSVWVAVSACAVSRLEPLSIPLVYKANPKNAGLLGGLSCNARSQLQASDAASARVSACAPMRANRSRQT